MRMMKRARNLIAMALVIAGTCMMLFSAFFLLRYRSNTRDMDDNSRELLRELERVIPKDPVMTQDPVYKDENSMPAIEIKGISCIGILYIFDHSRGDVECVFSFQSSESLPASVLFL